MGTVPGIMTSDLHYRPYKNDGRWWMVNSRNVAIYGLLILTLPIGSKGFFCFRTTDTDCVQSNYQVVDKEQPGGGVIKMGEYSFTFRIGPPDPKWKAFGFTWPVTAPVSFSWELRTSVGSTGSNRPVLNQEAGLIEPWLGRPPGTIVDDVDEVDDEFEIPFYEGGLLPTVPVEPVIEYVDRVVDGEGAMSFASETSASFAGHSFTRFANSNTKHSLPHGVVLKVNSAYFTGVTLPLPSGRLPLAYSLVNAGDATVRVTVSLIIADFMTNYSGSTLGVSCVKGTVFDSLFSEANPSTLVANVELQPGGAVGWHTASRSLNGAPAPLGTVHSNISVLTSAFWVDTNWPAYSGPDV